MKEEKRQENKMRPEQWNISNAGHTGSRRRVQRCKTEFSRSNGSTTRESPEKQKRNQEKRHIGEMEDGLQISLGRSSTPLHKFVKEKKRKEKMSISQSVVGVQ